MRPSRAAAIRLGSRRIASKRSAAPFGRTSSSALPALRNATFWCSNTSKPSGFMRAASAYARPYRSTARSNGLIASRALSESERVGEVGPLFSFSPSKALRLGVAAGGSAPTSGDRPRPSFSPSNMPGARSLGRCTCAGTSNPRRSAKALG